MDAKPNKKLSDRDIAFWRAYFEILGERVPLVDRWPDGTVLWQPPVIHKMLWYSGIPDTKKNLHAVIDWLMENVAEPVDEKNPDTDGARHPKRKRTK